MPIADANVLSSYISFLRLSSGEFCHYHQHMPILVCQQGHTTYNLGTTTLIGAKIGTYPSCAAVNFEFSATSAGTAGESLIDSGLHIPSLST